VLSAVHQHLSLIVILAAFVNVFNELIIYNPKSAYPKAANSIVECTMFIVNTLF
jgi:hypothetical protein